MVHLCLHLFLFVNSFTFVHCFLIESPTNTRQTINSDNRSNSQRHWDKQERPTLTMMTTTITTISFRPHQYQPEQSVRDKGPKHREACRSGNSNSNLTFHSFLFKDTLIATTTDPHWSTTSKMPATWTFSTKIPTRNISSDPTTFSFF